MATTHSLPPREPQSLKVTDLPTDILRGIFDHFKDPRMYKPGRVDWCWAQPYYGLPAKRLAILNSRLTCRIFHKLASPMLLPTVRVKLEQGSLDRLDEISRIPDVAGSVRGIEVILSYRPEVLANDLARFIARRKEDIGDIRDLEPHQAEIERAWDEYSRDPDIHDSGNTEYQALLRESYHEYQRRHNEQQRLIDSATFVDTIASAASRMPLFGSLLFNDEDIFAGHLTRDEREEPSLRSVMIAAEKWTTIEAMAAGIPPAPILSTLPVAIHELGISLREVGIDCFPMGGQAGPPLVQEPDALRAACQHLEEVNFWPLGMPRPGYDAAGLRQVNEYLGAILSGHSLDVLNINGKGNVGRYSVGPSHIGPALKALDGRRLKNVLIENAQFTQGEWDGFCAGIGYHLKAAAFSKISISDGTWGPSIDMLREKTASRCEKGDCEMSLYQLTGGEFTDNDQDVNVANWWDHNRRRAFEL